MSRRAWACRRRTDPPCLQTLAAMGSSGKARLPFGTDRYIWPGQSEDALQNRVLPLSSDGGPAYAPFKAEVLLILLILHQA